MGISIAIMLRIVGSLSLWWLRATHRYGRYKWLSVCCWL